MTKQEVLINTNFGHRVAEDEVDALANYFVETDNWRRLVSGEIDVVYGPKGSGKSALYTLLVARSDMLFDQDILLVPGEKPRGTPAFRDIVIDPPASEAEFVNLWKLYFLSLISATFEEYGIENKEAAHVRERLAEEGLVKGELSLRTLVHSAFGYVKRLLRPEAVEGTVSVDPSTQLPNGFTGKIIFGEPNAAAREQGVESIDHLLLADDEDSVRELMEDLLGSWGLAVALAENGAEACQRFAAEPGAFDLVVLDQTMPRMTGLEAAEQILKLRPGVPVVLYTGHSEHLSEARIAAAGIRTLIRKPLDIPAFRALVEDLLPRRPAH